MNAFIEGAKEGFYIAVKIIPFLVAILVAVGIFRASGAMDFIIEGITRFFALLGVDTIGVPSTSVTASGAVLTGAPDPFTAAYCNGGRAEPGPIEVFPAVDEAGAAWIDVRFGPLSVFGDYSLVAP